jgi:hypothetical protein
MTLTVEGHSLLRMKNGPWVFTHSLIPSFPPSLGF